MNTKHTPGPWNNQKMGDPTDKSGGQILARKTHIATCHYGAHSPNYEVFQANAKLIAAAPELLEALRELVSDCEMASGLISDSSYYEHDLDAARRAIAKATQ